MNAELDGHDRIPETHAYRPVLQPNMAGTWWGKHHGHANRSARLTGNHKAGRRRARVTRTVGTCARHKRTKQQQHPAKRNAIIESPHPTALTKRLS
jgi:hypothetical protein